MAAERVPPQSIPDEEAVLGELMDWPDSLPSAIAAGLEPGDFYFDRHRIIYRAIRKVTADGGLPDEGTTWEAIRSLGLALPDNATPGEEGIRRVDLMALTAKSMRPGVDLQKVERIVEYSRLRDKLNGAQFIQQAVFEQEETRRADLLQQGLELIVADLTAGRGPSKAAEIADEYVRYLKDPAPDEVFELPYPDLNKCILGGFRRKEVAVLGAWPEHGKSWLVDQMLTRWAEQNYRCVLFATEMDWLMRATRFTAAQTEIPMEKLLRKTISPTELAEAEEAVKKLPYDYHDAAGWNENMIAEQVILGGYDVAVIDVVNYLPEYVEKVAFAERICQRMLATAQRGNALVVLVSHFNRERDKGATKPRPVKRDLKQTSALEQIAGTILFLHRDETLSPDGEGVTIEPSGELFYAKTRTGMGGSIRVVQNVRSLTFLQEARPDAEEAALAHGGALPGAMSSWPASETESRF
jgi:replicative DNA helicase